MLVDIGSTVDRVSVFADESFAGQSFALDEDTSRHERALRAVDASRAFLDTILVSFNTLRPLRVSDDVDDATLVGAWVKDSL